MILIMGPAGAGKSIQGELLVRTHDYIWLSTGQLLRAKLEDGEYKERMENGELLSDEMVQDIVAESLAATDHTEQVILDGFPRNLSQANWLSNYIKNQDLELSHIVHIDLELKIAHERLLVRGRKDDTEDAIAKRFEEYQKITLPIIDHFKQEGVKVEHINGNQTVADVHRDVMNALSN